MWPGFDSGLTVISGLSCWFVPCSKGVSPATLVFLHIFRHKYLPKITPKTVSHVWEVEEINFKVQGNCANNSVNPPVLSSVSFELQHLFSTFGDMLLEMIPSEKIFETVAYKLILE